MKISELSQATQVPVPTIKFYIREGLLPGGHRTSKNQAEYASAHIERLALIRALQGAGLKLDVIARSLRAADEARDDYLIAAVDALERPVHTPVDVGGTLYRKSEATLLALIKQRGWKLAADDVSVRDGIQALALIAELFEVAEDKDLAVYADAADMLAKFEIPDAGQPGATRDAALRYALLGTVLFEPLILALRRMAHVARTRKLTMSRTTSAAARGPAKR